MPSTIEWKAEEVLLLKTLRPYMTLREIRYVFGSSGHSRTIKAINRKANNLGLRFEGLRRIAPEVLALLSSETRQAIEEIVASRNESLDAHGPLESEYGQLSPAQRSSHRREAKEVTRRILEGLNEIRAEVPRTSSTRPWSQIAPKSSDSDDETLVVLISDWHIGKQFKDVDGTPLYNVEIAAQRVHKIGAAVLELAQRAGSRIKDVVVLLMGDLVDGEGIYPGQELSLEEHVVEQTRLATRELWGMVTGLRKAGLPVRIATCRGNHGRGGISPESNWDNVIYQQLELLVDMQADSGLTISSRYGEYNVVPVRGWKIMIRHVLPRQIHTAAPRGKIGGWSVMHGFDIACGGHFHHAGWDTWMGKDVYWNGCIPGGDDYAEGMGLWDEPIQVAFTLSESNRQTACYKIKLS